jgi:NADH:ubiquinone oxidoreductase subunit 2 (subunit N)
MLNAGWYWIAIIAILASVLSAANYLHIVKVTHFDLPLYNYSISVSTSVSYLISILSTFTILFLLKPASLLILTTQLVTLTDFTQTLLTITPLI